MLTDRSVIRVKPDPDVQILALSFMNASITRSCWRAKLLKWGCEKFDVLQVVEWAGSAGSRTLHDVQVDHGGGDVGMAKQALDGADVGSGFQQVGGE